MMFGAAVDEMKAGKKVKRPQWADACSIEWSEGKPTKLLRGDKPYLPGHADLLAEDWMIS